MIKKCIEDICQVGGVREKSGDLLTPQKVGKKSGNSLIPSKVKENSDQGKVWETYWKQHVVEKYQFLINFKIFEFLEDR